MCKNSISKLLPKTSKDGLACFFCRIASGTFGGPFFFLPKRVRVWNCGGGPAVLGPLACSLGASCYVLPRSRSVARVSLFGNWRFPARRQRLRLVPKKIFAYCRIEFSNIYIEH